jgi:putative membrane protein insertion efficiency factor
MRTLLMALVRFYQLTLSALIGRQCRHLPSCSSYMIEALSRHGAWAGGWIGFARVCRCRPGGSSGLDFVCEALPEEARWFTPWRYGRWRGTNLVMPVADLREAALRQEQRD